MSSAWVRGVPLLVAALLGGGVAVGIGATLDDETDTVVTTLERGSGQAPASFAAAGDPKTIQDIYRTGGPGVVQVTSTQFVARDPFSGPQQARSLGSGFVIDKAGHIITNYHVIEGASEVEVNFSSDDGLKARVIGVDPSTDIAVLEIAAEARALTPLPLGDSDAVQVGDAVVAIGNPFGLERTVTAGIVSALQREIQSPNGFTIDRVIQTDAPINRGNSGGPLLNTKGEVVGVNTQIATSGTSDGSVGIGFAVPISTVREVVSQLIENGKVDHAYLGIKMQPITETLAETFRLPVAAGVLVAAVVAGSPAAKAGLEGGDSKVVVDGVSYVLGGDIITNADGEEVETPGELGGLIMRKKPGEKMSLSIRRGDSKRTVSVTLGRRPSQPAG